MQVNVSFEEDTSKNTLKKLRRCKQSLQQQLLILGHVVSFFIFSLLFSTVDASYFAPVKLLFFVDEEKTCQLFPMWEGSVEMRSLGTRIRRNKKIHQEFTTASGSRH